MSAGRRPLLILILVGCLLGPATAADAADRYASVTGSGTGCMSSSPCSLSEALSGSADGDDISVAPGTYALGAGGLAAARNNLTLHGPAGGPKPSITSSGSSVLYLLGDDNVVRDLAMAHSGGGSVAMALVGSTTAERVEVVSSVNNGVACGIFFEAVLRDSTCVSTGSGSAAVANQSSTPASTAYARNVTAIATGAGSTGLNATASSTAPVAIDARNVIARGGLDDVSAVSSSSGSATVTLTTSAFNGTFATSNASVTSNGANGNVSAAPLFVDGPSGNYRQLAASPTVNAGSTDARTGTTDFEGDARPQGSAMDIGADELPEAATPPVDLDAPQTSILSGPPRKTRSKRARIDFASSETGSTFECALDGRAFTRCIPPVLLRRLKPRRHVYEVRAIDAAGNVDLSPARVSWKVKKRKRR